MPKMSYVETVPPKLRVRHDWITMLSELVNSGHAAIRIECDSVREMRNVQSALTNSVKRKNFDVVVMSRGTDVYVVNLPKK